MKGWRTLIVFALIPFIISACASADPVEVKRTACHKLKSDIVFNAATSDVRQANQDRSERPLQEETYDRNNCDCY